MTPEGYGLIAKTEMLGTGDTVCRAFCGTGHDRKLIFSVEYTDSNGVKRTSWMQPIERRHLSSLIQTLRDVSEMLVPGFISE